MDEEILQDFLVEALELVEALGEQLMQLEQNPTDTELLNSVFRGFHTVKGGAGFLGVTPLIEICHRAENVFDKIRQGSVAYDAITADAILRAYDIIGDFINELNDGARELADVDAGLLAELDVITAGNAAPAAPVETATAPAASATLALGEGVDPDGEMTEEEFEALLHQRDGGADESAPGLQLADGADPDGDMTEEEFEALLNQRDGGADESAPGLQLADGADPDGDMTEEEFEALLNQRDSSDDEPASAPAPAPAPAEAKKPTAKPAGKANTESTVRVDTRRLDEIMNLVGELVLVRNRLLTLRSGDEDGEALISAVANLDHVTTDLQASVMKTRMQPVKKVFGRFPRVVRDLARKLGKEIDLELEGEETDLDKNLVEALADPLVHLVRNSVDHGIELPEVREAAGKSRKGTVVLAAKQEGDHILLSITDDGKGMDPDFLRQKAVEKGMIDESTASQMEDKDAFMLIMAAGFSTAEVVSDISGRGVGMDVVKSMIMKLNGSIEIISVLGKGSEIRIKVPLTLAILPTLMVSFGKDSYAIPLTSVQEIFDYDASKINNIDGQKMVRLREKSVPLFFLEEWFMPNAMRDESEKSDKVIIVNIGNQRVGLVVNQVDGQEEVVIKPLGVMMKDIQGYAGATITGNGSIALILDLPGVLERY